MNKNTWAAVFMIAALAACAKDDAGDDVAADTSAVVQPADASPTATPAALPEGATAEMVAQGQQIFTSTGNCYTCHGMDAKGTALAPDLNDQVWINVDGTYAAITNIIKTGVPAPKSFPAPMPAMGGAALTDEQVGQLAAYVWSLGGGK